MSRFVRLGIIGFMGGVAFRSLYDLGLAFALFALFIALLVGLFSSVKNTRFTGKIIFSITIFLFALGYVRTGFMPSRDSAVLEKYVGQKVVLEGVLCEESDVRENSTFLVVDVESVIAAGMKTVFPKKESVLLSVRKYPDHEYGERVTAEGKLALPENFQNENGRSFDYVSYLKKDGILYQMSFAKVDVVENGQGNPLVAFLYSIKRSMLDEVSHMLPEPESGLLAGLLFGAKRALGSDSLNLFRVAGIMHIVVLSGYNITIVADFFTRLFLFLPGKAAPFFGGVGIVLFGMMTGFGASTLRAILMALLVIFARVSGRTSDALHLLLIAGFLMVAWNPLLLLYDPSFQLSFLATLGLFLLGPEMTRRLSSVTAKWGIRETLSATLSTQVFVLPLLLYETGLLSLVAIPVNLLVLPLLPPAMFFGALGVLFSFITPFGTFFGFPVYILLSLVFFISSSFANLPFSSVSLPAFPISFLIAIYVLYTLVYFVYAHKPPQEKHPGD